MSIYKSSSLAMIPTAYKDGKLYSIRPTDGSGDFTFSRGSNLAATRVDVNGLIEKGRENLVLQSNQFDTSWSTSSSSITGGQSGYDGGSNAWLLQATASTSTARLQQGVSLTGVHTTSIYAKAGSTNWIAIQMWSNHFAYFDVANGVVGNSGSAIDASIEAAGNGFYRCSISYSASSVGNLWVYVIDGNGSTSVTSGKNVYLQSTQVELGLVATDYIETGTSAAQSGILEDMPRLDYSGSCPSLLLEPQRTNIFEQSEYFSGSYWGKTGTGSGIAPVVTQNYAVSPEGLQNASRVQFDTNGSASSDRSGLVRDFAFTTGDKYAISCWVKSASGSDEIFHFRIAGAQVGGEKTATNEWQLFTETHTATATTTDNFGMQIRGNYSSQTSDILIYGMQLESAVSYPTSYIPTYGTSQTRSNDSCQRTGATDLLGQEQGVVFLDFTYKPVFDDAAGQSTFRFSISNNTYTNRVIIYPNNSNQLGILANGVVFTGSAYSLTEGQRYKVAIAYGDTSVCYINGVEAFGYGSGTPVGGYSQIQFSDAINASTRTWSSPVHQALIFKTRLTNAELAALTTL